MNPADKKTVRRIKLGGPTCRRYATVDARDYAMLICFNSWYIRKNGGGKEYAITVREENGKTIKNLMARLIMNPPKGMDVDHKNGRTLDNRRRNLRVCTRSQNISNMKKYPRCLSRYKGVTRDKSGKRWTARIMVRRKIMHLGTFATQREAAKVYNAAAVKHQGEYAWLNKV